MPELIGERLYMIFEGGKHGSIDYYSFTRNMSRIYSKMFETKIKLIFELYDFDGDSKVTPEDVQLLLSHIPFNWASLKGGNENSKPDEEILHEQETELNQLTNAIFKNGEPLSFEEFKQVCEKNTSEIFLAPYILIKNKFPGVESISMVKKKSSSDAVCNFSPIKTLAMPRILSSFAPPNVKRNNSSTTVEIKQPQNYKFKKMMRLGSVELSNGGNLKKKSQFFNEMVKKNSDNKLDVTKNETDSNPIPPEEMDLDKAKISEIEECLSAVSLESAGYKKDTMINSKSGFVCLCGQLITSEDVMCDECKLKPPTTCYKEGTVYVKKIIGMMDKQYMCVRDKQIFFYKSNISDNPNSIYNLINTFIVNTTEEAFYDSKMLYGFTLRSELKTLSLYSESQIERNSFVEVIKTMIKMGNITEFYDFYGILGKGRFGEVREAVNKKTNEKVAIKVLKKEQMSEKDKEKIRVEVDILKFCKNENIIKFEDFFENEEFFFIVEELVSGGDFFTYFKGLGYNITEQHSIRTIYSLLNVLKYIHKYGIIHRDIKPENILLTSKDMNANIKLSDFGLAQLLGPRQYCPDFCGTVVFAAPEALQGRRCGKELDLWSCGVFSYYLLSGGYLPFSGSNDKDAIKEIINSEPLFAEKKWKDASKESIDFIKKLLIKDPTKRMTLEDALKHPWLASYSKSGAKRNSSTTSVL